MRILIILLFVSFNSFGQLSYSDIMSINSVNQFKKIMIENNYEFADEKDGLIAYGYLLQRDSVEGDKAPMWGLYDINDGSFMFQISRGGVNPFADLFNWDDIGINTDALKAGMDAYDEILEDVKKNCNYYDIVTYTRENGEKNDYLCYSCSVSKYKGKIGFVIIDGDGYIRHFPNE